VHQYLQWMKHNRLWIYIGMIVCVLATASLCRIVPVYNIPGTPFLWFGFFIGPIAGGVLGGWYAYWWWTEPGGMSPLDEPIEVIVGAIKRLVHKITTKLAICPVTSH